MVGGLFERVLGGRFMEIVVYAYGKCMQCRRALQLLDKLEISYLLIPLDRQVPQKHELEKLLQYSGEDVYSLFNISDEEYEKRGLSDQLSRLNREAALDIATSCWMLLKRPLLIGPGVGLIGFAEELWRSKLEGAGVR